MRVYMDNSATSFPKPPGVIEAMVEYMSMGGTNISRSISAEASAAGDQIFTLREKLADLFQAESSKEVIFTKNITESLNIVIKGYIRKGDPVVVSSLEHNAVMRPLVQQGAKILTIPVSENGQMDLDRAKESIPSAKALICTHVSNVSGDVMPIDKLSEICQQHKIPFILDTAQSAGVIPIDLKKTPVECLCFTGHKALLGPTGTGGMIIQSRFAEKIPCFITGGTGSRSHEEIHPCILPDKYEAGTQNIVGSIGLSASLEYLERVGIREIFQRETHLGQLFFEMLQKIDGIRIIGSKKYAEKPPVFSIDFLSHDNADISYLLANKYHIDNRPGLHCAPRAHRSYKTFPHGTVRLSLSHFTTENDLEYAVHAIQEILKEKKASL
ncbi:MAG: aminotransferase class V-fold PLP-dependent enzyme [Peptostreptococcaceae bacterium]|nr:aminotransferase class V-fold PLP-dependent enzyme [Peptostreptococcaceae bacterium]